MISIEAPTKSSKVPLDLWDPCVTCIFHSNDAEYQVAAKSINTHIGRESLAYCDRNPVDWYLPLPQERLDHLYGTFIRVKSYISFISRACSCWRRMIAHNVSRFYSSLFNKVCPICSFAVLLCLMMRQTFHVKECSVRITRTCSPLTTHVEPDYKPHEDASLFVSGYRGGYFNRAIHLPISNRRS